MNFISREGVLHVLCCSEMFSKLEIKHHCVCVQKIQYEGVCQEANTSRGEAEYCICLKTPPECCSFCTHKQGGALSVILYFLVVWLGVIFSSTQTAASFGDQDISKCSYNLFLVVQRTNRISLASFSDLQCDTRDQSCCLSGVVFKKFRDQMISKCLYNLFLAVERTHRISLAGFSDLQCVVYVTFHK